MELHDIISNIKRHQEEIIKILSDKNWQHFKLYFFIKEKFSLSDLDEKFKAGVCNFYIMNGARGFNTSQKEEFFKLLLAKESSLENILKSLYEVPGYANRHKLFLSFGTKLLHTINESLPIYDRNIAYILQLPRQISSTSFEKKIENRIQIYDELKKNIGLLLADSKVRDFINSFRHELNLKAALEKFSWQDKLISDVKLLDSLLWALYQIVQKNINP